MQGSVALPGIQPLMQNGVPVPAVKLLPVPAGIHQTQEHRATQPSASAMEAAQATPSGIEGIEPWLTVEAQQQRRETLHLTDPVVEDWIEKQEFISLGAYCGIARSLQCLGLKKFSYPFDWVRVPVFGLIHCLENYFCDFLSWAVCRDGGPKGRVYGSSKWGGSFWHHDPADPETRMEFTRRVERLYGLQEVPANCPRFFIRGVNSARELEDSIRLRESLIRAFPEASIYLLVLVDLQGTKGPIRLLSNEYSNLLFYRISDEIFADNGAHWTMQKQGEAYAEAIAFAARLWAGKSDWSSVLQVSDLKTLREVIEPFDGGSCAHECFYPRRFQCQNMSIRKPDHLQTTSAASLSLPPTSTHHPPPTTNQPPPITHHPSLPTTSTTSTTTTDLHHFPPLPAAAAAPPPPPAAPAPAPGSQAIAENGQQLHSVNNQSKVPEALLQLTREPVDLPISPEASIPDKIVMPRLVETKLLWRRPLSQSSSPTLLEERRNRAASPAPLPMTSPAPLLLQAGRKTVANHLPRVAAVADEIVDAPSDVEEGMMLPASCLSLISSHTLPVSGSIDTFVLPESTLISPSTLNSA